MLTKSARIQSPKDFSRVYKKGRQFTSLHLRVCAATRLLIPGNQNSTRFGFVISKKQASKIVARNRIKRILRETVRNKLGQVRPGYDVVIQGRKNMQLRDFKELPEELINLLKKAKII